MIDAARSGAAAGKLEAMTAVCSVGLDMIVIPGDTPAAIISAIIADEAAIGMVNSKDNGGARHSAIGKEAGEELNFGGLFEKARSLQVNPNSPALHLPRRTRIPAPAAKALKISAKSLQNLPIGLRPVPLTPSAAPPCPGGAAFLFFSRRISRLWQPKTDENLSAYPDG